MADKKLVALKPFLNGAGNRVKRGQPLDPGEYDSEILKHYIGLGMAGDKASLAPAEPTGTAAKKSAAAAKKLQDAEAKKAKKAEKAEKAKQSDDESVSGDK